jgi:glycosyltransferase involved in cell wall biosynthesis
MTDTSWIHLPPPGELYSPANDSSIPTLVAALVAQHDGETGIVAQDGLPHLPRTARMLPYRAGPVLLGRWARLADSGTALLAGRRPRLARAFEPVIQAVPADYAGPVFLHNAPGAVAVLRRTRPRARACLYVHNDLFGGFGRRERRRIAGDCHLLVFVSSYLARRFLRGLRVDPARVLVLPNGVDAEQFHPDPAPHDGPPTVLFVGRIARHKGPHRLIRACERLAARGVDFRLHLVGTGRGDGVVTRYERRWRRRAARLGDRVRQTPFLDRTEIAGAFRSGDVCCVPSLWQEPCALVLPEALASGLACVVAARGGLPEAGAHAAIYFDIHRPGVLWRRLEPLLIDRALRDGWRRQAAVRGAELAWTGRYAVLRDRLSALRTWAD